MFRGSVGVEDGTSDGEAEGFFVSEGLSLGVSDGSALIDGVLLGCVDGFIVFEGLEVGTRDGMNDLVGDLDGKPDGAGLIVVAAIVGPPVGWREGAGLADGAALGRSSTKKLPGDRLSPVDTSTTISLSKGKPWLSSTSLKPGRLV